ncbi:MAG: nitrile hydratase accessory protein [Cellvibrionaceae bacterium]|nr:nitrile hydratase accessory protein [Cellvibrionaceae bacterium]
MQTKFEHFAATSMMGAQDSPPRENGTLCFDRDWEGRVFGLAIALSKQGHYDWEDFRQGLMGSIAEWEACHALDDSGWDYYQRWLQALERLVAGHDIIDEKELESRTETLLESLQACAVKAENSGS